MPQTEKKSAITFQLTDSQRSRIEAIAHREESPVAVILRRAVRRELEISEREASRDD